MTSFLIASLGFGSGPYPGPNGPVTCTQLEHSEYRESGEHWNALAYVAEKKYCNKCGRPTYQEWFASINWQSRNIEYWREIFRTAADAERGLDGGLPFFYLWEADTRVHGRLVRGDEDYDPNADTSSIREFFRPKSVLTLLRQRYKYSWHKQWGSEKHLTLIEHIRLHRYRERLPLRKENRYPGFDSLLYAEIEAMMPDETCKDNYRAADISIRKDMQRYRKQKERGCCGDADKEVTIMGRKFMIGLNFGH